MAGGQRVFQSVQHIFLARNGVFALVFDMTKLVDDSTRDNALAFMRFWLRQVGLQARGAPVVVVGTHGDKVADASSHLEISAFLDATLGKEEPEVWSCVCRNGGLAFFPVDNTNSCSANDAVRFRLRRVIEQAAENDVNDYVNKPMPVSWLKVCDKLRKLGREVTPYLSLKQSSDEQEELENEIEKEEKEGGGGNEKREKGEADTDVYSIAESCGVFESCRDERMRRDVLQAMLSLFHEQGVVVYYADDSRLKNLVVLDPQWLVDKITCIIRDFGLHGLKRDRHLINGQPAKWRALREHGVLSASMLDVFWPGTETSHVSFLLGLMERIKLLCSLPSVFDRSEGKGGEGGGGGGGEERRYLVPSIVSVGDFAASSTANSSVSTSAYARTSLSPDETTNAFNFERAGVILISFKSYLPEAFFSRLVVCLAQLQVRRQSPTQQQQQLVIQNHQQIDAMQTPCVFYSSGIPCAGLVVDGFLCVARPSASDDKCVEIVVCRTSVPIISDKEAELRKSRGGSVGMQHEREEEFSSLRVVIDEINAKFFHGQLSMELIKPVSYLVSPALLKESIKVVAITENATCLGSGAIFDFDEEEEEAAARRREAVALEIFFKWFASVVADKRQAAAFARIFVFEGYDGVNCLANLKEDYVRGTITLESLKSLNIDKGRHRQLIIDALENLPPASVPPAPIADCMSIFDRTEAQSNKEAEAIRALLSNSYDQRCMVGMTLQSLQQLLHQNPYKVLHLSMTSAGDGAGVAPSGKPSLMFARTAADPSPPEPEALCRTIARSNTSIECVVLNSSFSASTRTPTHIAAISGGGGSGGGGGGGGSCMAVLLAELSLPAVVGWEGNVSPVAAQVFSECFYDELRIHPGKYRKAFDCAVNFLEQKGMDCSVDPSDAVGLKQRQQRFPNTIAAGIPRFLASSDVLNSKSVVTGHSVLLMRHIEAFFRHLTNIDAKWSELSANSKPLLVENGIDNVDCLKKKKKKKEKSDRTEDEFDDAMRQCNLEGRVVSSIEELYQSAKLAHSIFSHQLFALVDSFPDLKLKSEKICVAPLKKEDRALEKAVDDYGKRVDGPGISWLFDIVRGSIFCDSPEQIVEVVNAIHSLAPAIQVVRLKNRFQEPTPSGFRDVNMNLRIEVAPGVFHTCELQVHHYKIFAFSKLNHSHDDYEFFRVYFAGSSESVKMRSDLFKKSGFFDSLASFKEDHLSRDLATTDAQLLLSIVDMAVRHEDEGYLESLRELLDVMSELALCERVAVCLVKLSRAKEDNDAGTASSLNTLGALLVRQGKLDEARPFFEDSKRVYEACLGKTHPNTALSFDSLGTLLLELGELDQAHELLVESLEIRRATLGEGHIYTATAMCNLGSLYRKQGGEQKHDEALFLLEKSLSIRLAKLGQDHPDVASSYDALGLLFQDRALRLLSKEGDGAAAAAGSGLREDTGSGGGELARARTRARESFDLCLGIRRRVRGERHEETAMALCHLGDFLVGINGSNIGSGITISSSSSSISSSITSSSPPLEADKVAYALGVACMHEGFVILQSVLGDAHYLTVSSKRARDLLI